jgi:GAF domain-containing protein/CheY-like chemotaxis protein/ligand-binding sensor domain-containing protein
MLKNKNCVTGKKILISFKWLLCIFFISTFLFSSAQNESEKGLPFITNYEAKTYQAFPQTWSVQEDNRGIMYFGIDRNILEYDGIKWRLIDLSTNSTSTLVRTLAKDKNGVIYYGAYGDIGYLGKDSLGQTITKSLLNEIPKGNQNFLDVWSAYAAGAGIYFQSHEYIFRLSNNASEKKEVKVWKPQTKFMYSFYVDGNYYVHQQGLGLYEMVNDSLIFIPGSEFLGKQRMQIMLPYPSAPGGEKQYLVGMFYSGLYIYNGKTFRPFVTKADSIFKSGTILYKGLRLDNGNYVLSTTGNGVLIIDAEGNLLQNINRSAGLLDESVYAIYQDTKESLWLGLDNGISRVEISSPLTKFTLQSGVNTAVQAIKRFNGSIYIGTTNGLLRYDSSKHLFEPVPGIPKNQIFNLLIDGNELLVPGDGLFAIKDGKARTIRPSVSGDLGLSQLYIPDKNKSILFAGGPFGMAVFSRQYENSVGKKTSDWHFAGNVPGIVGQVISISENKDGKIWVGTVNGLVYQLTTGLDENGNLDKKKTFIETYGPSQGLKDASGGIPHVNGLSYFVADSFLYTFNNAQNRFVPDSTFGNLSRRSKSLLQFAMVEDQKGRVWIRAGKETRLATPKPGGGYTIDYSQLKSTAEFNVRRLYPESNGILWICTTDGLLRYDENLKQNFDGSFKTVIRHIEAGKEALSVDTTANQKTVSLSYKKSTLRFEYAAPFFDQEEKTQYQTWLEGFEKGWSGFDNNYYKEYTNLPSGDYHFHVRAKNVYGKSSAETVYSFSILPPWYRTWWAYLLYALAAISLVYFFINWKVRRLKQQHAELEKTVEERTSQLSQRLGELSVINSVQEGLVAQMNMEQIYTLVGDRVRDLFDAQTVVIRTYDHKNKLENYPYAIEKGERLVINPRPFDDFSHHLINLRKPELVNNKFEAYIIQYSHEANLEGEIPKSALFVPMILGDEAIGNLSLQNVDHENAFSDSDVSLISTLSNSMSVALENARLFDETNRLLKETEQRTAELSVINSVQEGLAKELDMQGIYNLVGERVQKLFNAQVVLIATFDHENQLENFNYHFEKGEISHPNPRPFDKGRKYLIETGQNILINENITKAAAEYGMRVVPGTEMPKSILFMPLKVGDKVTGYVSLQNIDKENAFSPSDVRLLSTLSNSMSVALENARLFDETNRLLKETEQRTAELSVINSVQEGLAKELHMQAIYEMVGDKLSEVMHTLDIDIRLFSPETNQVFYPYMRDHGERMDIPPQPMRGMSKYVYETCQTLIINEKLEERMVELGSIPIPGTQMEKSYMAVPIIVGNTALGMVSMSNYEKENAFSDSEVRLLQTVVSAMSVALENARLFDETNRLLKETEQRTSELAVINSVQEGLVAQMDIQSIYDLVGEKIRNIFNAQIIDIVTYDKEKNLIEDRYAFEKGDRTLLGEREPLGFRKHVIHTRQVFLINEKLDEISKQYESYVTIGEQPKSALFVPMITGGEVTGIISLQNLDHEHAFSDSAVNLLTTLANSMSVALKSAGLFDETNRLLKETEQRNAELAVINSVQESLVAKLDMAGIYELVGEKIRQIFGAQVIDIVTYDPTRNVIADQYAYEKGDRTLLGEREPNGFRKHVINTGVLLLHNENVERAMREFKNEILIGDVPKSQIYVPMISDGKVKGIISLQNLDHEHAFSDSDVSLLTTLSNSMSVALESARLFDETNRLLKETEQRTSELAVINSVQEGLVAQMDMQAIYDLVGEKIRNIFNAQIIDIVTYDKKNNLIEDRYSYEKGDKTLLGPREPLGFRKHVIESPHVFLVNEKLDELSKEYDSYVTIGETPKSAVFVPMMTGSEITGIISLQNLDHEHAFSESDVNLLTTLANSMSVALKSAGLFDETNRLLQETEQRNAELAVINSVQDSLVAKMDMAGIYELVGEKIREIFNAQVIDIVTYDPDRNVLVDKYSYEKGDRTLVGERKPTGFRKHIIQTGSLLVHNENVEGAMLEFGNEILIGDMPKSQIYVPMIADGRVKGIISLQNLDQEHAFSESDVSLLTTLTNSMSVALESARLFDETTRLLKETEQRNAELAVITSVQESLVAKMDVEAIYYLVGEKMREVFNAQVIDIATYDSETNLIEDKYAYEKGDRTLVSKREPYGFRKHVIDTGQILVINKDMYKQRLIYDNQVVVGQAAKSLVMAPLMAGGKVNGVISLQNLDKENAFSQSEISLLSTLVNSMSVALKSARLFDETIRLLKETEQRTAELGVINSVQEGLVREMNTQSIFNLVGDRICSLFPETQTMVIRTFDVESQLENWQYAIEKGVRLKNEIRPLIWANKQLIINKKPFLINKNYIETAKKYGGAGVSKGQPPKSAVFVPMIVGDDVKGSLSLQNVDKEDAFTDADIRLLTTVTNSMSVAIENARLFDETTRLLRDAKQRATELSTVNNISKALASQLNPTDLIQLVGNQLKELFNANIVYLALLNKKTNIIYFPYQFGDDMTPIKLGEGLTSNIILKGEPLLINKSLDEETDQLGLQRIGIPAASYLGVPIPVGDEIIGVLSIQSTEQENRFDENDQRLLSTIGSSVGVALKNAQLFEDVEQAKMEAELATKNAEKANQAKSAFLSTVSHELRTPLTSVLGFAKIIRKRLEEKIFTILDKTDPKTLKTIDQITENLKVVISEGERLTHLINDVLDLAKIEAGKMEWDQENVSLAEVVERAVAATTSLFDQKDIKLVTNIDTDIPNIIGDTDKLIQVVINLFSNAVKFTDKGSVTCKLYQKNNEAIVSISDTGIGIAKEDFGAVFEQFKQVGGDTLTDKPKGTGLGLPICKEIVEHHGGRIWLESKVGKGSTFSFALPLIPTGPKNKDTPIHLNELMKQLKEQMVFSKLKIGGKNATILVVDDDDSIRSLLHQELSDAGYVIEEARDGKMALESIRKNRPDLIILDVMMPEINGFDVAAILKNDPQTMDIPIIILSIVQDKARGFRIGVDRYLTKPIDTAKLFEEVGSLLEQGKSKKKVMVVDEDSSAVRSLTEVLQTKGYIVVESDGKELVEKAISTQPDIIILNSVLSDKNEIVQSLRFEKGLENVLFLIYQ